MLFVNHSGECTELFRLSGPVHTLLMRADMALMAVLTQEMNMSQYSVTYNGKISQIMNVRTWHCVVTVAVQYNVHVYEIGKLFLCRYQLS